MESAPPQFAAAQDIPRGGLLLAVPALLAMAAEHIPARARP